MLFLHGYCIYLQYVHFWQWYISRLKSSPDKNEGTYRSAKGVEEPVTWPRIWVMSWKEIEKKMCEDNKWDEQIFKYIYQVYIIYSVPGIYIGHKSYATETLRCHGCSKQRSGQCKSCPNPSMVPHGYLTSLSMTWDCLYRCMIDWSFSSSST